MAIVSNTSGPLAVPTASRTTHPPKQTALMARSVILKGEIHSRHEAAFFSGVLICDPPNASDGSQPPRPSDVAASEPAGSRSLDRLVRLLA